MLNKGMKDDKDNSDRRLVCQHLNDLLHLLTNERDRQRAAWRHLNHASPFRPIELSMCSARGTLYASVYLGVTPSKFVDIRLRKQITQS